MEIVHTRGRVTATYDTQTGVVRLDVPEGEKVFGVSFRLDNDRGSKDARANLLDRVTNNLPFDLLMAVGELTLKIPKENG